MKAEMRPTATVIFGAGRKTERKGKRQTPAETWAPGGPEEKVWGPRNPATIWEVKRRRRNPADEYYRPYVGMINRIGRERGWSGMNRAQYEALRAPGGALHVGSPQEVIDKILAEHEIFANDRFLLHLSVGTLPHDKVLHAIEMFGTQVAPVVRRETKSVRATSPA